MRGSVLCFVFCCLVSSFILTSCGSGGTGSSVIKPGADAQKQILDALIKAPDGSVIELAEGKFDLTGSLSLEGKKNITFKGQGKDKTVLSFAKQSSGAEGLIVKNCQNFTVTQMALEDPKGDGIKVQDSKDVLISDIRMEWTGVPDSGNGNYGLYPVTCENVIVEKNIVRGASDAGIYVGQSINAIVRNNHVYENVAGIEVENTYFAEVYGNKVENNTGGIMIFDLPGLPKKNGHDIKVYKNVMKNNNHENFSEKGITVYMVPPGVGFMVMATDNVEVYDNDIEDHKTISIATVSYGIMNRPLKDSLFNPFLSNIHIYNNRIKHGNEMMPDTTRDVGRMVYGLQQKTKAKFAIIDDGAMDPKADPKTRICIRDNQGDQTFFNLSDNKRQLKDYVCTLPAVKGVESPTANVAPAAKEAGAAH
jgi:parallel beta-helix repeat protein